MGDDIYRPSGKEYLYVNEKKILKINGEYITDLKKRAKENGYNRATMCLHNDVRAHVHEMINVFSKHDYIRPHCHPIKTETKVIIEGELLVVIFDEAGKVLDEVVLSREQKSAFTIRIDKGIYHTNIALTETAVFHEIVSGPFTGNNDNVYPIWAPEVTDFKGIEKFMQCLKLAEI